MQYKIYYGVVKWKHLIMCENISSVIKQTHKLFLKQKKDIKQLIHYPELFSCHV